MLALQQGRSGHHFAATLTEKRSGGPPDAPASHAIDTVTVAARSRLRVSIALDRLAGSAAVDSAAGGVVLALLLEAEREPPAGYVQHGAARWRFVNRVELLQAIDAAYHHRKDR